MSSPNKGWKGGYSDTEYLGNPADIKDRQFASSGSRGYDTPGDIGNDQPGPDADIYMVPDFQGMSGQGANQSTSRPIGST
jgi:hypothetical protein